MNQRLSIIARDKDGRMFIATVDNPKWIPFDVRDVGTSFEPRAIYEVRSQSRLLYQEPYQPR